MNNLFSQVLKDLRIYGNYSQESLAKCLNVSKGIISLWENGMREPTLSKLVDIADFFDVTIDYLAGRAKY